MLKINDYTATNIYSEPTTFTIEKLKETIRLIRKDPLIDFMERKGCSPDNGGIIFFPADQEPDWGTYGRPKYVRVSSYIREPFLVNSSEMDFTSK